MPQLRHFSHIRTLYISLVTSLMASQAIAIEEPVVQITQIAWLLRHCNLLGEARAE